MPSTLRIALICSAAIASGLLPGAAASGESHPADRVGAVLRANELAVGPLPRRGTAVYRFDYSGSGLTGRETQTVDLGTGAYVEVTDSAVLHFADGYDGHTPWMRDISGANTPQEGGDRVRLAVNEAYRNANVWWRSDRGGAQIDDLGLDHLAGAAADHLAVLPRGGVRFEAWFDAQTHLLLQIAEPRAFLKSRRIFSDYRREAGVQLAHSVLNDSGTGEAGYERLALRSVTFAASHALTSFACPQAPPGGITLAHGATSASVPFRLLNNHIYVEGRVNGTGPYTFIVDTGGHTLLSGRVVAQARLAATGNAPESGAGEGQSSTGFAPVQTIAIGDVEMHDQVAFATEIYSPEIEGIPVDGMVGFELIRRLVVEIDYGRQVLTFSKPGSFSPRGAGIAIPFVFYDHVPFVRGQLDGMPARFDIDTGSRSELDVTSPTVARDRLREQYRGGVRAVTGWGVGGPVHSYVVRLHSVTLGTMTVNGPVADFSEDTRGSFSDPNFDANIGSGFLKRFVVTLDYGRQRMYLRRLAPPPPDAGTFDRAGVWINATPDGYRVTSVAEGSPAAQAGLTAGDVIVELDGAPSVMSQLSEARTLLRMSPSGSRIAMLVKGQTGTRRVELVLRDQI